MHRWFLTFPLNVIKGHRVSFCNYICYGKLTKNQYFNSIPLQFHVKLSNRLASDRCRLPVNPITQCIFATRVLIPREIKNKMQNFMAKPICIVACTQTLIADIYFPAFLYLSLALGGLLWENRGSVNRLENYQQILRTWIYESWYYSLSLEILRFDSQVWTAQKYWTVPCEQVSGQIF